MSGHLPKKLENDLPYDLEVLVTDFKKIRFVPSFNFFFILVYMVQVMISFMGQMVKMDTNCLKMLISGVSANTSTVRRTQLETSLLLTGQEGTTEVQFSTHT